jgi:hypothetical protein
MSSRIEEADENHDLICYVLKQRMSPTLTESWNVRHLFPIRDVDLLVILICYFIPKYYNFAAFSKDLLDILVSWVCSAFCVET